MLRFAAILLALALVAAPRAEAGRTVWPKTFDVQYCWGYPAWSSDCPTEPLSLNSNNTWIAAGGGGTWFTTQGGRTLTLLITGNTTRYDGTRQTDGHYAGTMTTGVPGGPTGYWQGWYR